MEPKLKEFLIEVECRVASVWCRFQETDRQGREDKAMWLADFKEEKL